MIPIVSPAQAQMIRAAVMVLRDLHDDGYIDFSPDSLPDMADKLDALLATYCGCSKAPELREVTA